MSGAKKGEQRVHLNPLLGPRIYDPREYLRELGLVQAKALAAEWDMPWDEKRKLVLLRRGEHKKARELRDACVFACLFEQVLAWREGNPDLRVRVAPAKEEAHDADAYAVWDDAEARTRFAPLQMKELPPGYLNATASLDELLLKLRKYPPSPMPPVVAVYLNRREFIPEITVPGGLNIASIWLFGATEPDSRRWALIGDLLENTHYRNLPLVL